MDALNKRARSLYNPLYSRLAAILKFTDISPDSDPAFCSKLLRTDEQRHCSFRSSPATGEGQESGQARSVLSPTFANWISETTLWVLSQVLGQASEQHLIPVRMPQPEPLNPEVEVVNEKIKDATRGIINIHHVSGNVQNAISIVGEAQTVLNEVDMWNTILGPLKAFNAVAGGIGEVHTFISV
ncbi:hypothetical protein BDR07DRAFT_1376132 [Suillus spraguei]|nr:hypothetical protein BDR07DRAFT_1376132 [Suillus spraguei]